MKKTLFSIFLIINLLLLTACGAKNGLEVPSDAPTVKNFTYTNQDGKEFGLKDLKGKVWIADFIFTNCETVCPPLTANFAKLQEMAKDNGVDLQLVSFSVDPEFDTPEKMKEYGENFQADFKSWSYLTGYSQKDIEGFALNSFQAIVQKPKSTDQVIHSTSFFLVNQDGKVVKSYPGLEETPYEEIINDIKSMQ